MCTHSQKASHILGCLKRRDPPGAVGAGPEEGHENHLRAGTPLL